MKYSYKSESTKNFKGKKVTIMGLGLLGRGIGYTKFLAEAGADLIVTDLKTEVELATSIKQLSKFKNIKYSLGGHRLDDFKDRDMIMKAAGVPLDSVYIKEAKKNKIPIEMDASLFMKLADGVTIVGVTGTRGKSMTTMIIYEILKSQEDKLKKKVYLGGNLRGYATLPLLTKVKKGDIVILELDSWQLQGFGESHISPQISVFTTFMQDHMNYYKDDMKKYFDDKANIFKYQKEGDTLVTLPSMKKLIPKDIKSKLIVANAKDVEGYKFIVPGKHQIENLACAVDVAKLFKISDSDIKKAVKDFKGIEGRLQYIKTVAGVKIYNDNNATTPQATVAGIEALSIKQRVKQFKKNIILIAGGQDKGLDIAPLAKVMNKYCKDVVFLDGTGTQKLVTQYKLTTPYTVVSNIKEAASIASGLAKSGDIVLFSPAFASFGMFTNEYDRNDQFMKIVKKLN